MIATVPILAAIAQAAASLPLERIDPKKIQPCQSPSPDTDVVICGRREEKRSRYRLPLLAPDNEDREKAELSIGGRTALAGETESVNIGGRPSNRIMFRFKLKF